MVEAHRGKAGSLEKARIYFLALCQDWAGTQSSKVAKFMAVIDARHMIVQPNIFWDSALPHFTIKIGNKKTLLVQYPQWFSNQCQKSDVLDNSNLSFYLIFQTLRDCAKVITSCGTNAIWRVDIEDFSFSLISCIEDTGTSHNFLGKFTSVHLPNLVAHGIAKSHDDFVVAISRWVMGAVQLLLRTATTFWKDFLIVAFLGGAFFAASFCPSFGAYLIWVLILLVLAYQAYLAPTENGNIPFREYCVSATIVLNCTYWVSNLISITFIAYVPIMIGK